MPYLSSRDRADRGPAGRTLGNSKGGLDGQWGEVRGRNGVVIVAPFEHEKAATGGRGARLRTGLVPPLPGSIGALLVDAIDVADTATDAEVARCLAEWTAGARPALLNGKLNG